MHPDEEFNPSVHGPHHEFVTMIIPQRIGERHESLLRG